MKLRVEISDIAALMAEEVRAGERAVQFAIKDAGEALKSAWRAQVVGAGMGQRLARTIRSETWPKHKHSMNAASMVWTRAPVLIDAHDSGPLIRGKNGLWLAIPTEAAGKARSGKRPTPDEWRAKTGLKLIFVHRRAGPSLLIAEARLTKHGRAVPSRSKTGRGLTSVPIFLLVPQVRLRKRLDLERPARAALNALPGAIVSRWERNS
ncbi:hypothetical protein SAMN05421641_12418 [Paracoccus thiocyanatus]|uniref:Uncharacterized protein n=1 Tax=Paracoccus thiocyanatus TaxID=34006 RepID=A0A1N6Y219_9RHOB|nr:DUF6441 family protein [Paracoccus thiocyanatus]SIR08541.1 hypothetical protein SAMN05421641_12418 [Paracoccus thiocyanatus]